jgi:hypothetical protein
MASNNAISSAAGLPLPDTSPTAMTSRPSSSGRKVAADGVGGTADADGLDAGRGEQPAREHRLLNLARDLEVVLERQPVGDFEQDQQVHQHEREEQRPRALTEQGAGDADAADHRHAQDLDDPDAAEQIDETDERETQRDGEHDAPRRRQFHRERHEEDADVRDRASMPGQALERVRVDAPREELVRLARVAREQALEILRLEIAGVVVEERLNAAGPR